MVALANLDSLLSRHDHDLRVDAMRQDSDATPGTATCQPMNGHEAMEQSLGQMRLQLQQLQMMQSENPVLIHQREQIVSQARRLEDAAKETPTHSNHFVLAGKMADVARLAEGLLAQSL